MNVVQFISALDFGGAPRGTLELMNALSQNSTIQQHLVVLGHDTQTYENSDILRHVPEYLNYTLRHLDYWGIRRVVRRMRHILEEHRADILHTHLLGADYIGALACRGTTCVHVSHIRGTSPWMISSRLRDRLRRWCYRRAFQNANTRFLAVSQAAAIHTETGFGIPSKRIDLVLNGIDPLRFPEFDQHQIRDTTIRIGTAGRFAHEKGHADLIEAVARLQREIPHIRLVIAGQGQLRPLYKTLCRQWGIEEICQIVSPIEDMNQFLRHLDIFVLPSRSSEGLARVLMEAMYCGTAIVASQISGSDEAVTDRQTGRLYPVGDIPELVRCLRELALSPTLRSHLAEAAKRSAGVRFTVSRVAAEVNDVYHRLRASSDERGGVVR